MDLKKRLAQLDRLSRKPGADNGPAGAVDSATPDETLKAMGLEKSCGSNGPCWTRSRLDELPAPGEPLPSLHEFFTGPMPPSVGTGDILFMDTETTGLVGGTGTIPFLVGLSWWQSGRLCTRQVFMPDPGHEDAMLGRLEELASRFRVVVTFNGASYDLPLIRTRARLNRRADPFGHLAGWDLLVPSRRLWANRLENCRQQTLETEICGMSRTDGDIEGSRIPQTWFDFLATGRPGLLPRVLTHNHRDMVGMGRLFLLVVEAARFLETGAHPEESLDWRDGWALGRICEKRRDTPGSVACLESAVRTAPLGRDRGLGDLRFLGDAVRILKRGGDWTLVAKVIDEGLAAGVNPPWLHREAAILYEHRLVDLPKALDHALKSGEDQRVDRLRRMMERG